VPRERFAPLRFVPAFREEDQMRAETEAVVNDIKQSLDLLRRYL
jgi:hypothetical protein